MEAEAEAEAEAETAAEPAVEDLTAPVAAPIAAPVADKLQRARARVIKIRRADAAPAALASDPAAETAATDADLPATQTADVDRDEDLARLLRQTDTEMSEPENRRRLSAIQHLKAAVAATVAERRAGVPAPSDEDRSDLYRDDLSRAVRPVRPRAADGARATARPVPQVVPPLAAGAVPGPAMASGDRPAPLVLVSEQRIDRVSVAPSRVSPARPRRVGGSAAAAMAEAELTGFAAYADADLDAELQAALLGDAPADSADAEEDLILALSDDDLGQTSADAGDTDDDSDTDDDADDDQDSDTDNIFGDSKGFAEFADRLGASDLPDLLEAAAAYATCVENRDHFTRPLLMRRLEAGHLGDGVSREDGLRSFGVLLREGRIEKVRRGHYALPDDSNCLAEARKLSR